MDDQTPGKPLTQFAAILPGFFVPNSAQPAFYLAFFSFVLCNFTTTYTHPYLPYLRLLLTIPALYGCWSYGFSHAFGFVPRKIQLGMAFFATYGAMKMFELCILGFWNREGDWPRWLKLRTDEAEEEEEKEEGGKVVPFTPTILGRLAYAFDLATAAGSSWYRGRAWNWAAPPILSQPCQPLPRPQFVLQSLTSLLQSFLILDVCESILATHTWDTTLPRPLTDGRLPIPIPLQMVYATCVCARTIIGTTFSYTFIGMVCGLVFDCPSTAFPPMFDHPFASRSLAELWASKWHKIHRRSSNQISGAILSVCISLVSPSSNKSTILARRDVKLLRSILIFGISCLVHLIFQYALATTTNADHQRYPSFFNAETIKFFLSQPLGVAIEVLLIRPLTDGLPERAKVAVRRVFPWAWMLWSGRYFADVWMALGLLDHAERDIVYSPVRGILKGQWRID